MQSEREQKNCNKWSVIIDKAFAKPHAVNGLLLNISFFIINSFQLHIVTEICEGKIWKTIFHTKEKS